MFHEIVFDVQLQNKLPEIISLNVEGYKFKFFFSQKVNTILVETYFVFEFPFFLFMSFISVWICCPQSGV